MAETNDQTQDTSEEQYVVARIVESPGTYEWKLLAGPFPHALALAYARDLDLGDATPAPRPYQYLVQPYAETLEGKTVPGLAEHPANDDESEGENEEASDTTAEDFRLDIVNCYWLLRNRHNMAAWSDLVTSYATWFADAYQTNPPDEHQATMLLAACLNIADATRPLQAAMVRHGKEEHKRDDLLAHVAAMVAGSLRHMTTVPGMTLHDEGWRAMQARPTVVLLQHGAKTYRLDVQEWTGADVEPDAEEATDGPHHD